MIHYYRTFEPHYYELWLEDLWAIANNYYIDSTLFTEDYDKYDTWYLFDTELI